jgi:3-oxoacyl-[acyl-carrier protein] reductase
MADRDVVLITGTRKGIGRFLAEHFVRKGASVVGCSRKPVAWQSENYEHHIADVANESQVKAMVSAIRTRYGRLDIAINNAGVAAMNLALLTPIATVDRIMRTNFYGTFLVCRESAKLMMKQRRGRIVNISTVAVPLQLEGEAVYAASKSAIVSLTQILARELAEFGITCNIVGLPPIETDLIRSVPKDKIDHVINSLAIKRMGRFEDVANVVDFFVKPESDYVTGQTIYLGGV